MSKWMCLFRKNDDDKNDENDVNDDVFQNDKDDNDGEEWQRRMMTETWLKNPTIQPSLHPTSNPAHGRMQAYA